MADERPRAGPLKPPRQSPRDLRQNLSRDTRQDLREDPGQGPDQDTGEELRKGPRPERQVAFRTGISAESRAAAFLIAKGFRILARRWRSPLGEIDIIARRRTLLIFVEVKARENLDDAAWSVTERQRQRIAAAAEVWLAHNPDACIRDIRFDAMLVAPGRIPRHITAAFDASN
jgi:putative endonuclease